MVWVLIAALAGQEDLFVAGTLRTLVIAAGYDALVAFLIFPFARWACGDHDLAHR